MKIKSLTLAALALTATCAQAKADPICTIVIDAETRSTLIEQGDCDSRVTPASTFKIPLSAIGFDVGVLQDTQTPELPFREGYVDWGGENWRQPTTPARWMEYSVVWYSRQITPQIGEILLTDYLEAFSYGNADFTGDAFQSNGLERAWMTSSLLISPREQASFLARFLSGELPIAASAMENTISIIPESETSGGWRIQGKSGTAYPRDDAGRFDYTSGWGWFVGWAQRGEQTVIFAHLLQDDLRQSTSPGSRAEGFILADFDTLSRQFGN